MAVNVKEVEIYIGS